MPKATGRRGREWYGREGGIIAGSCQSGGMDTRDGGWVEKEVEREAESSSGACRAVLRR